MNRKLNFDLKINYDLDNVLEMAECYKSNPNYETYKEGLIKLIDDHIHLFDPKGYAITRETNQYLDESNVMALFCIVTTSENIDAAITEKFNTHEYLDGMLLNSLADNILFEATNDLYTHLKATFEEEDLYLTRRFEPGNEVLPMEYQQDIYDVVVPEFDLKLGITEGFMLSPTKSLAYFYGLGSEDCSFGIDHDCSVCDSADCKQRKYIIRVQQGDDIRLIQGRRDENLLDILRRNEVFVDAPCSGMGTCGKCRTKVVDHKFELKTKEKEVLSKEDIEADVILSCYHTLDSNITIIIDGKVQDNEHEIEVDYEAFTIKEHKYIQTEKVDDKTVGIGIDIGTTTVAISLIDLVKEEVLDIIKILNPQKPYGADVISRIMQVGNSDDNVMCKLIRDALESSTLELLKTNNYRVDQVKEMVISGNTTMMYLLLDIDPSALAVSPFTTIDKGLTELKSSDLFKDLNDFPVAILPFVSAYVGGDIISGLLANDIKDINKNIVFVDIGTNGEMVVKAGERLVSAATAAGPAFEGANIKCGMGSLSGAICEIKESSSSESGYEVVTLGNKAAEGICGSALIDAIALLHKQGFIEDSGFMEAEKMLINDIGIYPEDVRQVQLAKAAILAGVDVLLDIVELSYDDIDEFYIAGGFGSHININNSAYIGLIPKEVVDKVKVVGNASLAGSVRYLLDATSKAEVLELLELCEYEELSTNMKFMDAYIMGMAFGG